MVWMIIIFLILILVLFWLSPFLLFFLFLFFLVLIWFKIKNNNKTKRIRWNAEQIQQVWNRTNGKCYFCQKSLGKLQNRHGRWEMEHIQPISKGGTNDLHNIVASCCSCNRKKGTKSVQEFLLHRSHKHKKK